MAGFDTYLRTMLVRAATEARRDGSTTVEAQHLLLAIAADQGSAAGLALASAGLDAGAIREALDREFAHSLTAAGVDRSAFDLPPASPDPHRVPHPGDSVRLALERGVNSAADRPPEPAHLLIGILRAEVGTVPRALAMAGVDRADLIARVTQTLSR
jgi:D-alanyl-D-alanine carboxypeptidase